MAYSIVNTIQSTTNVTFKENQLASGKKYLEELLDRHHGNVRAAAVEAGRRRQDMYKLLARFNIAVPRKPGRGGNAAWHSLSVAG